MTCKHCNSENENGSLYCSVCGNRLDGRKQCRSCGKYVSDDNVFCNYCGTRVDGKTVCGQCGTAYSGRYCPHCGAHADEKGISAERGTTAVGRVRKPLYINTATLLSRIRMCALYIGMLALLVSCFFIGGQYSVDEAENFAGYAAYGADDDYFADDMPGADDMIPGADDEFDFSNTGDDLDIPDAGDDLNFSGADGSLGDDFDMSDFSGFFDQEDSSATSFGFLIDNFTSYGKLVKTLKTAKQDTNAFFPMGFLIPAILTAVIIGIHMLLTIGCFLLASKKFYEALVGKKDASLGKYFIISFVSMYTAVTFAKMYMEHSIMQFLSMEFSFSVGVTLGFVFAGIAGGIALIVSVISDHKKYLTPDAFPRVLMLCGTGLFSLLIVQFVIGDTATLGAPVIEACNMDSGMLLMVYAVMFGTKKKFLKTEFNVFLPTLLVYLFVAVIVVLAMLTVLYAVKKLCVKTEEKCVVFPIVSSVLIIGLSVAGIIFNGRMEKACGAIKTHTELSMMQALNSPFILSIVFASLVLLSVIAYCVTKYTAYIETLRAGNIDGEPVVTEESIPF